MIIETRKDLINFIDKIECEGRDEFIWKDLVDEFNIELGKIDSLFGAFKRTGFSKIDLRGFDASEVTSMKSMFYDCERLKSVNLNGIDTSSVETMSSMFSRCRRLKEVDLSSLNTSGVEKMTNMFCYCSNLQELDLSNFDTSRVKNMSMMFSSCVNLQKLDLSSFDTSNVKEMSRMFSRCESLQELNVSSFNTSNVKSMQHIFSRCENISSLDITNFDTSSVEDMQGMFYRCENLQILDLSSFDLSNVENLNSMFGYCSKLENVKFPESGKCTPETAEDLFKNCGNLKEAKLPNFDFKDTDVSYMFLGCSELERVDFSNTTINNTASVAGIFRKCSGLTELVVNDNSNIYDLKRMAKEVDSDDIKIAFRDKKMSLEDINEELRDAMREENLKTIDDKLQDEVRSLIKKYYLKGEDKELFINAVNEVFSESEEKINQFRTTNLFD